MFGFTNHQRPLERTYTEPMVAFDDGSHATDSALMTHFKIPMGLELIAKEDIFTQQSEGNILLIRSGTRIEAHALPKLIRHGASPSQFVFREVDSFSAEIEASSHTETPSVTGTTRPDGLNRQNTHSTETNPKTDLCEHQADNARIVIIETNDTHLQKTLNILNMSGVLMGDIQCATEPNKLIPFVQHHQPSILIVDESTHPITSMVPKLNALKRAYNIQHIVLTVNQVPDESTSDFEPVSRDKILEQAQASGIEVVYKPFNLFGLSRMLRLYKARKALQREVDSARSSA